MVIFSLSLEFSEVLDMAITRIVWLALIFFLRERLNALQFFAFTALLFRKLIVRE